ncbi:MAG: short-chain dehydrogenase [Candidatus Altiarchaeales archaeon WOR_SM1_79]|nr:MAG: short-chain dehydrogenase [Candidatus Altiarchaeales archaeon WOR_SM1_79]
MERLKDRIAIVTGSAQGMGYAIAHALAKEGAKVVITDIKDDEIERAVAELKDNYDYVLGKRVDVTNKQQVKQMVCQVIAEWAGIDILVNNAGGALHTPYRLDEIEEKDWDLVVNVNLKGTFFCCQQVIPVMVKNGRGTIINISALAAHWRASLAGVQYTAAKAGVEGLTRQLAYDWGQYGIRINAIAPTVTITGGRVKSLWEGKGEEERERVLLQIPLRRLGTPNEIASTVVFLASDESSYITGITIDVSGGRYLR